MFSLDPNENPKALKGISDNKYLPKDSLVLPGSEIFDLFKEATKFEQINEQGEVKEYHLRGNWEELEVYFANIMADMQSITTQQEGGRFYIENWFEVLKKVMRLNAQHIQQLED